MKPTILTLQDHHRKGNSLYGTLAHLFPNCTILEVRNAHDAVAAALAHPPNVFLMDMNHLRGKGGKLIEQLKRILPDLSVVLVVKEENEIYRTDSAAISADAYISEQEVVHFLERLTRSMAASPVFESGERKRRSGSTLSKPRHLVRQAFGKLRP